MGLYLIHFLQPGAGNFGPPLHQVTAPMNETRVKKLMVAGQLKHVPKINDKGINLAFKISLFFKSEINDLWYVLYNSI